MAGADIGIEIDARDVLMALAELVERVDDLRPVWRDFGEHLLISHRDRWGDEESPDGDPWAPLDPEYRQRKPRNADQILVLDGYLRDLLRYQESDDEIRFGTDRVYGATHQFGDPDRGIPARPWLGMTDDDSDELLAIVRDHLEAAADT